MSTQDDITQILDEALAGLKGIGEDARNRIRNDFAPVLVAIASAPSQEQAAGDLEDLKINIELAGWNEGIGAEAQVVDTVNSLVMLAAKTAFAMLPAVA